MSELKFETIYKKNPNFDLNEMEIKNGLTKFFYRPIFKELMLKHYREKLKNDPYFIDKEKLSELTKSSFFNKNNFWIPSDTINYFNSHSRFRIGTTKFEEFFEDGIFCYGNENEGIVFTRYSTYLICNHIILNFPSNKNLMGRTIKKGWFKEDDSIDHDENILENDFFITLEEGFNSNSISKRLKRNLEFDFYSKIGVSETEMKDKYKKFSQTSDVFLMSYFLDEKINNLLKEMLNLYSEHVEFINSNKEEKEKQRVETLGKSQNKLLKKYDKDGNGIIDVIEGGDDFDKLFKKNQKKIIENDKTHIQQFVKISKYLKTKRNNLQETFKLIQSSPDKESLKDLIGMLKNQIHTYELIVFNSITMLVSLIEDDLITFYEIYELFDELNIFNSNFENQVSNNLSEMNHKLGDLMYSIDSMERNIVKGFKNLSYDLDSLKVSMENNLKGIQSSLDISNFMTKFPNYPTYRIRNEYTKLQGLDI